MTRALSLSVVAACLIASMIRLDAHYRNQDIINQETLHVSGYSQ